MSRYDTYPPPRYKLSKSGKSWYPYAWNWVDVRGIGKGCQILIIGFWLDPVTEIVHAKRLNSYSTYHTQSWERAQRTFCGLPRGDKNVAKLLRRVDFSVRPMRITCDTCIGGVERCLFAFEKWHGKQRTLEAIP